MGHFVGWLLLVPVEETTTCNLPQVTENLYQVHLTHGLILYHTHNFSTVRDGLHRYTCKYYMKSIEPCQ